MARRIDPSWIVVESLENDHHDRCVDLFRRPDGSWGFEEFRRDVEDRGAWSPVACYSARAFATRAEARRSAETTIAWLPPAGSA